ANAGHAVVHERGASTEDRAGNHRARAWGPGTMVDIRHRHGRRGQHVREPRRRRVGRDGAVRARAIPHALVSTVRVRHISGVLLLAALGGVANVRAQVPQDSTSRKQARAFHVSNDAVRLDGRLDEAVWSQAPPVYDFVQKEPTEGGSPSDRIEVKFLFDDDALYVGARMWSRAPSAIQAPLSRRDSVAQAERFFVALDTYLAHRTAYRSGVTASGVRIDTFYSSDNADTEDPGFDPVWEARASVDSTGWTAELWIPFSQLRFSESAQQVWGLNVGRLIPTAN